MLDGKLVDLIWKYVGLRNNLLDVMLGKEIDEKTFEEIMKIK